MDERSHPTGHDAPLRDKAQDFYDRWPIATSVSRLIASSPAQWSTRIGIFGPWGGGKTSVLNFVEEQQRAAGNIVIRYAPWGASTPEEVWRDFGKVLIQGLKKNGIALGFFTVQRHRFKSFGARKIGNALKAAGALAELSGHAPGAATGSEFASTIISDKLTFTSKDIGRLIEQLGERRVVVFIDDLDRTDAVVVPKLLLVLRELLDLAQFVFVLAFDRTIVAAALQEANTSWGKTGESFLDKVIDFPIDLPRPATAHVRRLARDQFGRFCPFVPIDAVERISSLLPENPRKLKLLARMVASMKGEVDRHEAGELDWDIILLIALLRAENEPFAERVLALSIDAEGFDWEQYFADEAKKGEAEEDRIKKLIDEFPHLEAHRKRLEKLVRAWRDKLPAVPGERVRYQAMFALTPHCITWGEFKDFLRAWRKEKAVALIETFLHERERVTDATREAVEQEFSGTVLSHYSTILEKAAEVASKSRHLDLMQEGLDTLDLLLTALIMDAAVCRLEKRDLSALWERLHHIATQWRHFTSNELESDLRKKEVDVLIAIGRRIADPLSVYQSLKPWRAPEAFFGMRQADLRKKMTERIRAEFEADAIDVALRLVRQPGELRKLTGRDENVAARFFLTAPASPLFGAAKEQRLASLEQRFGTDLVVEDAGDYLVLILAALEDGEFANADKRKGFIQDHADVMKLVWALTVSEPSQFRMLNDLRERRKVLVSAGIDEESLTLPPWLAEDSGAAD